MSIHILFALLPCTLSAAINVCPVSRYFIVILCGPNTGSFKVMDACMSINILFALLPCTLCMAIEQTKYEYSCKRP